MGEAILVTAFRTALPTMPSPLKRFTANDSWENTARTTPKASRNQKSWRSAREVFSLIGCFHQIYKEGNYDVSLRCLHDVGCADKFILNGGQDNVGSNFEAYFEDGCWRIILERAAKSLCRAVANFQIGSCLVVTH